MLMYWIIRGLQIKTREEHLGVWQEVVALHQAGNLPDLETLENAEIYDWEHPLEQVTKVLPACSSSSAGASSGSGVVRPAVSKRPRR